MIFKDFEKKVLFWQLRGMYRVLDSENELKEFLLEKDNVTFNVVYNYWHGNYHILTGHKTTFNQVTIEHKTLEMDELIRELETI